MFGFCELDLSGVISRFDVLENEETDSIRAAQLSFYEPLDRLMGAFLGFSKSRSADNFVWVRDDVPSDPPVEMTWNVGSEKTIPFSLSVDGRRLAVTPNGFEI